jgi:hypothetical protein
MSEKRNNPEIKRLETEAAAWKKWGPYLSACAATETTRSAGETIDADIQAIEGGGASAEEVAAAVWGTVIEGSTTVGQALCAMTAVHLGKTSGNTTTTITIRNLGDTANRVTSTMDPNRNRAAVTLELTGCMP